MKFKENILLIALCGFFAACSGDDVIEEPDGGKDGNEDPLPDTGTTFADFDTYDTTPYFFRYGNSGNSKSYDYYPRWIYSHTVVDNPLKNDDNSSSKVLEYTSMEARNYGLKFRFKEAMDMSKLRGIRFQIYQPDNVIGKTTWKGTSKATSQRLAVKLLGRFNAVNDYTQEEGVLLTNSSVDFTENGVWKTYTFTFSKNAYSSATTQLANGIHGIAILPTYSSEATLAEENKYKCYIDDIEIL